MHIPYSRLPDFIHLQTLSKSQLNPRTNTKPYYTNATSAHVSSVVGCFPIPFYIGSNANGKNCLSPPLWATQFCSETVDCINLIRQSHSFTENRIKVCWK